MYRTLITAVALASSAWAVPYADYPRHNRQTTNCTIASSYAPHNVTYLPDPFTFANGNKVATLNDFACRQKEMQAIMEQYELGTFPGPPDSLTATMSGDTMTVNVTVGSKSVNIVVTITKPSNTPGPAIIAVGGSSIPIPATVGTIVFDNDQWAQENDQSSRGVGDYYTLFGNTASAGATTAWAWGADRIIDGLEKLGPAVTGINTTLLGTTGCSRDGKGAFMVGALCPRIALTIPQESGSGGAACWRISDQQLAAGQTIQTASEIVQENVWFSPNFNQWSTKVQDVPEDHHFLAGMIAPRGLFVIENNIDWLGPVSTTGCMDAGRLIYKGVGVPDNMGFSLVGNHAHCAFPAVSQADLTMYINAFLLGGATPGSVDVSNYTAPMATWAPWTVPMLS
ncbi:carbohydrate esterase family 15 protein [Xylariaceae sp. FL0255]|nr:carbohydrate esterase family 15 protein [Xylariaceae sp. FL0255]